MVRRLRNVLDIMGLGGCFLNMNVQIDKVKKIVQCHNSNEKRRLVCLEYLLFIKPKISRTSTGNRQVWTERAGLISNIPMKRRGLSAWKISILLSLKYQQQTLEAGRCEQRINDIWKGFLELTDPKQLDWIGACKQL